MVKQYEVLPLSWRLLRGSSIKPHDIPPWQFVEPVLVCRSSMRDPMIIQDQKVPSFKQQPECNITQALVKTFYC